MQDNVLDLSAETSTTRASLGCPASRSGSPKRQTSEVVEAAQVLEVVDCDDGACARTARRTHWDFRGVEPREFRLCDVAAGSPTNSFPKDTGEVDFVRAAGEGSGLAQGNVSHLHGPNQPVRQRHLDE